MKNRHWLALARGLNLPGIPMCWAALVNSIQEATLRCFKIIITDESLLFLEK